MILTFTKNTVGKLPMLPCLHNAVMTENPSHITRAYLVSWYRDLISGYQDLTTHEEKQKTLDLIVDELENHVETFKQIAGMGEESRPYFSVTPDEYIEYMDFDDPDRKVVFVVNGEEWEDYKPFTTGAEEIGKIEDLIPGFNIVDLNYVVNPD